MLRKVSTELHPFVTWVLERDGIPYSSQNKGGIVEIRTENISSRRFNNVVKPGHPGSFIQGRDERRAHG